MIVEECETLREQLIEFAEAKKRQDLVEQLEFRRKELSELFETVKAVTDSLEALKDRTEIIEELDSSKAVELLQKVRATLEENPKNLTSKQTLSGMNRSLTSFVKKGTSSIEATWKQYVPKASPRIDESQLAEAAEQNDFKSTVSRIRDKYSRVAKQCKKPPANEEEFIEIESVWQDIRQMMEELPDVADDPQVQEFLKAANSQAGASIELLTEEVRAWLAENNIAEKYRITTM